MVQGLRRRPKFWYMAGSFFWHQLQRIKSLFLWSTTWEIGTGNNISFWGDNWQGLPLLSNPNSAPQQPLISLREAMQDLALTDSLSIPGPVPFTEDTDKLVWRWGSSGTYSAKSAYKAFFQGGLVTWRYRCIWKCQATPTAKVFAYLMLNGKILTRDVLRKWGMNFGLHCVLCMNCPVESILHALLLCPYAVAVWFHIASFTGKPLMKPQGSIEAIWDSLWEIVRTARYLNRKDWTTGFVCTAWYIWKQRNAVIFREEWLDTHILALRCLHELKLWRKYD